MSIHASVNYHIPSPNRQAYEIDAGGIEGKIVSPTHAVVEIEVADLREQNHSVCFAQDSVEFMVYPTSVSDFENGADWKNIYDAELVELLEQQLGAKDVIVFDHTVRIDDPASGRKPARNVHSDYSRDGAHQRLEDLLGKETAAEWEAGHFAFINVWRPVSNIIKTAPLGFVKPSSVAPDDWLLLDLIYTDRTGQIMGLTANAAHRWVYLSDMAPNEVAFFNIYDNQGQPSIAHSALDLIDTPSTSVPRKSIESRTLVRY